MNNKEIKIKIEIIKTIYDALLPVYYRLNSILEDAVSETVLLSELEMSALLEFCACSSSLKLLFEAYFEMSDSQGAEEITIPESEYITVLTMSKTVEAASRTPLSTFGLWVH